MPTLGEMKAAFNYSPETGEVRWAIFYRRHVPGDFAGGLDAKGYRRLQFKRQTLKAHRVAWLLHYGEWPALDIDHINGIRDDNRISNLRLATKQQNAQNYGIPATNKSGVAGVCWNERHKKWRAHIRYDGKQLYLGAFERIEDASSAYLAAKTQFHPFQPVPREVA